MWNKNNNFLRCISYKNIVTALIAIILHGAGLFFIFHLNNIRTLISLKQIGNGPLYIMNYHGDYKFKSYLKNGAENYEELNRFIQKRILHTYIINNESNLACSAFSAYSLKDEPIFCRNLDISGSHPAVLLYSDPPDGYASVSMVDFTLLGYPGDLSELKAKLSSLKGRKALLASPYMPRDGMNEYGLAVSTLNMPVQTPERDPSKVTIGRWQVLRLLLDHAKNVDEALELIKKYNCFDGEVHFFIADARGDSAIIEHIDNKIHITRKQDNFQIATNFAVAHPAQPGGGHDRYDRIYDTLAPVSGKVSEEDAMKLLSVVSMPSTAWSVIYNHHSGEIRIVMDSRFNEVSILKFKKFYFNN